MECAAISSSWNVKQLQTAHYMLKSGYFIADGSATGKVSCGAAILCVTETGEVRQCALEIGSVVSAFWTERRPFSYEQIIYWGEGQKESSHPFGGNSIQYRHSPMQVFGR